MKRLFCLMLAVVMLMSSVCAVAEIPSITNGKLLFDEYVDGVKQTWSAKTEHSISRMLYEFTLNTNANIKAAVYEAATNKLYTGVENSAKEAGKVTLWWNGVNTEGWHPDKEERIDLLLKVEAQNEEGQNTITHEFGFKSGHNMSSHQEIVIPPITEDPFEGEGEGKPASVIIKPDWKDNTKIYSHNTVCSFGPHFRDISPELTDKWYMFTPIDLSQNGKQVYEMVGGNAYIIGTVSITVNGDEVVVDYNYLPDVYAYDEFYTFFPDYESITTVNPNEIDTAYEYGQKLSIANDLGGDTSVLLFTCNTATFKSNNDYIVRFYENVPWRAELRSLMLQAIGMADEAVK